MLNVYITGKENLGHGRSG